MTNDIDPTASLNCLAIAGNCSPEYAANILRSHGHTPEANWILFTTKAAPQADAITNFSSEINSGKASLNIEEALNIILHQQQYFPQIALILAAHTPESHLIECALLGANIPAKYRFVVNSETIYPLEKYINIHCKPSENDWAESDGESVACILYGNVGKKNSGLHSIYFGKSAYEKFIDSYYLDDLIKTKYIGYLPEKFYFVLYFALAYYQKLNPHIAFTELGATLWGTIDKISICHSKLNLPYRISDIEWNSIELSDYLRQLSHLLHPNLNLNYFDRWQNYFRKDVEIGFSHLVSPYAFHDEISAINWVKSFGFCLWVSDFTFSDIKHLKVNGKTWTLLPLKSVIEDLKKSNFGVYLIDARDLDPEGQIKRTSLIIFNKERFSIDQYFDLIKSAYHQSPVSLEDFRNFDFDPANLWTKFIDDPDYFIKCAKNFSAGFAGALAITPTRPYEFKWSSPNLVSRVKEHLQLINSEKHTPRSFETYKNRLIRFFSID